MAVRRPGLLFAIGAACALAGMALAGRPAYLHNSHYRLGGEALQLAFDPGVVERLFADWRVPIDHAPLSGLTLQWDILFPGDTLLPIGYGLAYLGLLSLMHRAPEGRRDLLRWVPVVAMGLDLIENQLMADMLTRGMEGRPITAGLPLATGLLAVGKYAAISVVTPMVGVARAARRWRGDRRARWLGAGLLALVPVAFVVKAAVGASTLHGG